MREFVKLVSVCENGCKSVYTTDKNKKLSTKKLEFRKYCKVCRKHVIHRESK